MRILKWTVSVVIGSVAVVAILIATIGWMLSTPVSEETLAKMQSSKQFQAGKFVNEEPEASFEVSIGRIAGEFEARLRQSPTGEIPVISIDAAQLKSPQPRACVLHG